MNDKQPIESLEAELAKMDLGDLTPEQVIALIREPYQHFAFSVPSENAIRIYTKECTYQITPSTLSVGVDLAATVKIAQAAEVIKSVPEAPPKPRGRPKKQALPPIEE